MDVETLLHVLEVVSHLFDRAAAHTHLLRPKLQRLGRGAEARRPVDRRGASHRAALQDDHAPVFGAATGALLIEIAVGRALLHVELARGLEGPCFEENHAHAGLAQGLGCRTSAGTGADDDHVCFESSEDVSLLASRMSQPRSAALLYGSVLLPRITLERSVTARPSWDRSHHRHWACDLLGRAGISGRECVFRNQVIRADGESDDRRVDRVQQTDAAVAQTRQSTLGIVQRGFGPRRPLTGQQPAAQPKAQHVEGLVHACNDRLG